MRLEQRRATCDRPDASRGRTTAIIIIIAPVVLGGGEGLFDGFARSLDLEHLGVRQSSLATFVDYRVKRS